MFQTRARGRVKTLMLATLLTAGLAAGTSSTASACAAKGFIHKVSNKMLKAAKAGSVNQFRSLIKSYADVGAIGTFALGKHRKLVVASQKKAYQKGMTEFMAKTLAEYGKKFRAIEVEVGRCAGSKVNSRLIRSTGRAQPIIWKVKKVGSNYKVVDLQVQNIWVAPLMRTTFADVIKKGGGNIKALYDYLGV